MEGLTFDVGLNASGFNSGIGSMENALGGLGKTAGTIGGIIAGALGGAAVIGAIDKSIDKFHEMETGLREISTLVDGDATVAIERYGQSVENIMRTTGDNTESATDAVYNFVSAFGDVADSAEIIDIASREAVAGVTDTNTAIQFLATTIFGFGKPATADMALEMANLGQIAVKQGRTTLPQLEAAIGKVIPTANALTISEKEFFATMAAGTKSLGTTSEVATKFQATLTSLLKPTEAMESAIAGFAEELNLGSDATATTIIQAVGLQSALEGIAAEAEGNTTALADMFGSSEALNFVLAITGELSKQVAENMNLMENSTGAMDEAYAKMADSAAMATKKLNAEIELLTVAFGDLASTVTLPVVQNISVVVGDITDAVKQAKIGFENWRTELDALPTFKEKLDFTLDAVAEIATSVVDAAGGAIDNLADYLRVNVLGMPADGGAFSLSDLSIIAKVPIEIIKGAISWFGKSLDSKADTTRTELGLEGDKNDELDIGDIKIIAKATWDGFTGGLSDVITAMYNEAIKAMTGAYPEGINAGEQKITMQGVFDVADFVSSLGQITFGVTTFAGLSKALFGSAATAAATGTKGGIIAGITKGVGSAFKALNVIGALITAGNIGGWIGQMIGEDLEKQGWIEETKALIVEKLGGIFPDAVKSLMATNPVEGMGMSMYKGINDELSWFEKKIQKPAEAMGLTLAAYLVAAFDDAKEKLEAGSKSFNETLEKLSETPAENAKKIEEAFEAVDFAGYYAEITKDIDTSATETNKAIDKMGTNFDKLGGTIEKLDMSKTQPNLATNLKDFFDSIVDALTPPDVSAGGFFEDTLKSFEDFYNMLFNFGDKSQEALEAYNEGIKKYNETIVGTDLPKLPELKIEPPKLADSFDADVDSAAQKVIDAANTIGESFDAISTAEPITLKFNTETNTTEVIEKVAALSPQIVTVNAILGADDGINAEKMKSSIAGLFEGAQEKIDTLRESIADALRSGKEEKFGLDAQIESATQKIQVLKNELGKGEKWWDPQISLNIEALKTKILELTEQKYSIGIQTEGLDKVNVGLGLASLTLGLLNQGAQIVVNVADNFTAKLNEMKGSAKDKVEVPVGANMIGFFQEVSGAKGTAKEPIEIAVTAQTIEAENTLFPLLNPAPVNVEFAPMTETIDATIAEIEQPITVTVNFEPGEIPGFVPLSGSDAGLTPGRDTTAPISEIPMNLPNQNVTINFNGDTIENNESSRQRITEMVYEGLKEAGVTP